MNLLGTISAERGDLKKAKRQFSKALALIKNKKKSVLKGYIINNLGIVNTMEGNFPEARLLLKESISIYNSLNEISSIPEVRLNLGMVELKTNKFNAALKNFEKALQISENEQFKLVSLKVCSETGEIPEATVVLSIDGKESPTTSQGGGPVDAAYKAIEMLVKSEAELQLYSVNNITSGTDSQGEVTVRLSKGGRVVNGLGADTDIVIASVKAYINALNKIVLSTDREHPQLGDV